MQLHGCSPSLNYIQLLSETFPINLLSANTIQISNTDKLQNSLQYTTDAEIIFKSVIIGSVLPSSKLSGWLSLVSQSAEPLAWGTPSLQDISGLWKTTESLHLEAFYKGITELWVRFSSSLRPGRKGSKWKWNWAVRNSSCTGAMQGSGCLRWAWRGEGTAWEEQEGDLILFSIRVMLEVRATFVAWKQ